jgi:hypothetical protein
LTSKVEAENFQGHPRIFLLKTNAPTNSLKTLSTLPYKYRTPGHYNENLGLSWFIALLLSVENVITKFMPQTGSYLCC